MPQKNQMGKAGRKLWELVGNGFVNTENPWESTKERKTGAWENGRVNKRERCHMERSGGARK